MTEILGLFASIALVAFTAIAGWMLAERCKQRLLKRKWGRGDD